LRPLLTLSPSSPYAGIPRETKKASNSNAIDVFPAPDKPTYERFIRKTKKVSQIINEE
jgi:hypothetical protein